ncbi:MAG: T9SS type A sorting domain-containing protein [Bacteroidetes bacterium]|nr:T9SS type A sorting domain-containing protein [Bacteroidota bacterium]
MTKHLLFAAAIVLLSVAFFSNTVFATTEKGDTLVIHQTDQNTLAWNEIVAADTNADGSRKHLVYELDPDGWYPLTTTLAAATYDLTVIGGKRTAGQARPCILAGDPFGGWYMLSSGKNVTFKGLHIMQVANTLGGAIGSWARSGLEVQGENCKVVFHDCIWDHTTGFSANMTKTGINLKVTNCLFRFSKPLDNSVWAGQGLDISGNGIQIDTIIIQNCTWYGGGPFMLKTWGASEKYFKMDHVTIVDFVQWPIHGVHWVNARFTNNVFYNAYTMGEDSLQVKGQDPELLPFGVINVDTVYVDSLGTVDFTKEATRVLVVHNNNNFVSQKIKDYWAIASADPATYHEFRATDPADNDGFINSRTKAMFAADATWPNFDLANTTSLDPQFQNYFDYADTLVNYSKKYYDYAWPGAQATMFMMDPDGEPYDPTDPMVYNLKVNNATLRAASTTGGPVGDLTWDLTNGYNSTQDELAAVVTTGVEEINVLPRKFALEQNYPNPFNPSTTINFSLAKTANVHLTVYNLLGQKVATLINNQRMEAGPQSFHFDASKLTSGVYFYKLVAGDFVSSKKMLLLK